MQFKLPLFKGKLYLKAFRRFPYFLNKKTIHQAVQY